VFYGPLGLKDFGNGIDKFVGWGVGLNVGCSMVSFGTVGAVSLIAPGDDCPGASARRYFRQGGLGR
jgi:hypothetical protein